MSELSCGDCSSPVHFQAMFQQAIDRNLVLMSATVEVTHRCNLRCTHCYLPSWESPGEWSTQELKDFLDDLAARGVLYLTLTGGEFFLRPDCMEILRYARERRFSVAVISNGTLIDRETADELAELAVTVSMSIYGADEPTYLAVTNRRHWYAKVEAALELLRERGVTVIMRMLVTRDNVHQVEVVQAWADSLGYECVLNHEVTPQDNGGTRALDAAMTDEQYVAYLARHRKPVRDRGLKDPGSRTCGVGFRGLAFSPTGDVYPCIQMKRPLGNARRQDLGRIWKLSPQLDSLRRMKFSDFPVCSTCEHSSYCGICAGLGVVEHDDIFAPNTTSCRTAAALVAAGLVEGKEPRPLVDLLKELPRYGEVAVS